MNDAAASSTALMTDNQVEKDVKEAEELVKLVAPNQCLLVSVRCVRAFNCLMCARVFMVHNRK